MSYTDVELANLALGHLPVSRTIESLGETSKEAKTMKRWLPHAKREALEAYDWYFARKRLTLALHATAAPENEWVYRYQYPQDCAKFRYIEHPVSKLDDNIPYSIESVEDQITIVTDMDDAIGVYTRSDISPFLYPAHFAGLVAVRTAYLSCRVLGGRRTDKEDLLKEWRSQFSTATAADANEVKEDAPRDADWIRGRA